MLRDPRLEISVRIAGSVTSETNRQLPTPITSTRPRLASPRWAATSILPKPIIDVSEVNMMALVVLDAV